MHLFHLHLCLIMAGFRDYEGDFYSDVYEVVCLVFVGCVMSYGAIVCFLGLFCVLWMVGYVMNASFGVLLLVFVHWVVNCFGVLIGWMYFWDL